MERELNWGIIGTGVIAREMGAALKAEGKEIWAVCATSKESARRYADAYGVGRAYGSAGELLADPMVDIVYIATPHSTHYALMQEAIRAGKHILCEKSITVNSRELRECTAPARQKGLVVCDGNTILHMPLYRRLRRMVAEGAIGKVKMVQVSFGSSKEYDPGSRFFAKELAGGALLDIGVYAMAFARLFLESQPNVVLTTAGFGPTGVDESSGILLKNPEGQLAVVSLTLRAKQPKRGVVAGEKGFIEVCEYPRAQRATVTWTADGRTEVIQEGAVGDALRYEVRDMERYVREGAGEENLSMVEDVMELLTAVRTQWGLVYPFEEVR